MQVLPYRPEALNDLVESRVSFVEEKDLATGSFLPVFGGDVSGIAKTDLVPFKLTNDFVVGRFLPIPKIAQDSGFLAQALSLLYQRNWTSLLLDITLRPLNFEIHDDEYYFEISERTVKSTRARYSIIRLYFEIDGVKNLRCVAVNDRRSILPKTLSAYDLFEKSSTRYIYKHVEKLFHDRGEYIHIFGRSANADMFSAMNVPGTHNIETIIVSPLTVGGNVRGFLNIGYDIPISLNSYMTSTFATMFNHMAIAIENFQKLNEISDLRLIQVRDYIERFHLDLLQGFRHAGHNALFAADGARERMLRFYSYKGDTKNDPAAVLEASHQEIELAFENMASLKEFADKKEVADLVQVFDGARSLLDRQLVDSDVSVRVNVVSSGNVRAIVNKEAVRSAFANLILNSIQAMVDANTKKSERKITVNFKRIKDVITVDFVDSGPGVRVPAGDIREIRDIWVPGKTSKKKGTGYGLPMVREVFQHLHNGSVDLRNSSRGGAHFRIVMSDGGVDRHTR